MLDEVVADVSSQLDALAQLGVQIRREDEVPEVGPTNGGLWYQVPGVTAVFADLKGSTNLNANDGPQAAAYAYTYFIRAMSVIMDRFSAGYVDIQGDGIFGLFSGPSSEFQAMACAITMRTQVPGPFGFPHVIASAAWQSRRRSNDGSPARAQPQRDCHVAALLAMTTE